MPDDPVRLRPIEEADLNLLRRLDTDPAASQPFEWTGFRDPGARRRRWEQDGWISRLKGWPARSRRSRLPVARRWL